MPISLETLFPVCRALMGEARWETLALASGAEAEKFVLALEAGGEGVPGYAAELARLELALARVEGGRERLLFRPPAVCVNPTLEVLSPGWTGLASLILPEVQPGPEPSPGPELLLAWLDPATGEPRAEPASASDLLALKITAEGLDPQEAAREGRVPVGAVDATIRRAVKKGLLLSPPPALVRDPAVFPRLPGMPPDVYASPVFTLQWHLTQACDLSCRHCYDRSDYSVLPHGDALGILDSLREFCLKKSVTGHVSFSGGNPLLHPRFLDLYREASGRGFSLGVLGNPSDRRSIETIVEVEMPAFFQVSLEGLREQNDHIRGPGHFDRTLAFLATLRDLGVFSMVMLTLTRRNMGDVIPLARLLEGQADLFTYNRLSQVGRGKDLPLPGKDEYAAFMERYLAAAKELSVLGRKDNLLNAALFGKGEALFGGCTGHGCGAAFNFISILPDGAAHACRKFPSPIGDVVLSGVEGVYEGETARRFRAGSSACRGCAIRPVCGGCMGVAHGAGLDVFADRDPLCPLPMPG